VGGLGCLESWCSCCSHLLEAVLYSRWPCVHLLYHATASETRLVVVVVVVVVVVLVLVRPPINGSNGRTYRMLVMFSFFFFALRSPSSLDRSP